MKLKKKNFEMVIHVSRQVRPAIMTKEGIFDKKIEYFVYIAVNIGKLLVVKI